LGLSMIAAALYIIIRDVQQILAIFFQAFFYLTPILYPLDILPANYQFLFKLNPFFYFVKIFRFPVYYSVFPPLKFFLVVFLSTVVVFTVGFLIFYKEEKNFVFHLS
jgi:ABC-type polysaccharide/polyol phosphate export permease